jgi:ribosomal protein L37AE/L43A
VSKRPDRIDSKSQAMHCSACGAWPATIRPQHGVAFCEQCGQPKEPPKLSRQP